jgi:ABC-type multidrug transport system fused ATPase/permease subunit
MLSSQELDIVLSLIQLVALVLPANAILLQVLQETYKERYELNRGEYVEGPTGIRQRGAKDYTLRSRASSQFDYILAQWSIHIFVFSAFGLISSLIFHLNKISLLLLSASGLLRIGSVLIAIGFLLFGISVLFTKPRVWKRLPQILRKYRSE